MLGRKTVIPIGAVSAAVILMAIAIPYDDTPLLVPPAEILRDETEYAEIDAMPAGLLLHTKMADTRIGDEISPFVRSGADVRGSSSTLRVPDSGGDAVWHVPNPAHEKYHPLQSIVEGYPVLHVYESVGGAKNIIMGNMPVPIEEHTNADIYSGNFIWMRINPDIQIPEDCNSNPITSNEDERIEIGKDVLYVETVEMMQVAYPDGIEDAVLPLGMSFMTEDAGYSIIGHITKEQAVSLAREMISIEQQAIQITDIRPRHNTIALEWNEFGDASSYKIVVAPASDPTDRTAYTTDGTRSEIIHLNPGTRYMIRVGVQGQDHMQEIRYATTVQVGAPRYDGTINLRPNMVESSDKIELIWIDSNKTRERKYCIERSVDGGVWHLIDNMPKQEKYTQDTIRSDWLGKTVSYRVFDMHEGPGLYSKGQGTVRIPSELDAPQNLRAEYVYAEGTGHAVFLAWDHAPLFRDYIIDRNANGSWIRIDKTLENSAVIPSEAGIYAFRVSSHINGITSMPAEITITVP